ncbi:MAG: L-histidine N(alpha)-methyltransferase [Thermoanaerobaculia bacterium]
MSGPAKPASLAGSTFGHDVARDLALSPKQLQSKYLYDGLGIRLFESICQMPWYSITRAELSLLSRHALEISQEMAGPLILTELGPGDGEKTALLAAAFVRGRRRLATHLIDISQTALEQTEHRLGQYEGISVVGHRATYEEGLRRVAAARDGNGRLLVQFLGSNLGNFDTEAARTFLASIRAALRPEDALLLGADLVKPEADLLLAYDDPLGVTAAFNKNLLVRINRELGGNFDLAAFDHRALFNPEESRVEMHLVSRRRQDVAIPGAECEVRFEEGETIWTESSYKYSSEKLCEMVEEAGFSLERRYLESQARFTLDLYFAS